MRIYVYDTIRMKYKLEYMKVTNTGEGKNMLDVATLQLVQLNERAIALPKRHLKQFSDFPHPSFLQ